MGGAGADWEREAMEEAGLGWEDSGDWGEVRVEKGVTGCTQNQTQSMQEVESGTSTQ